RCEYIPVPSIEFMARLYERQQLAQLPGGIGVNRVRTEQQCIALLACKAVECHESGRGRWLAKGPVASPLGICGKDERRRSPGKVKAGAIQRRVDDHHGRYAESSEAGHHRSQLHELAAAERSEDAPEKSEKQPASRPIILE